MNTHQSWLTSFLSDWKNPVGVLTVALVLLLVVVYWEFSRLMLKSMRRNFLRSALTLVAIASLVFVVTLCWSILSFLDDVTAEKSKDFKIIITEKHQLPSQMPWEYASKLEGYAKEPRDAMTWQFYGGHVDPKNRNNDTAIFFFCMEPSKLITVDTHDNFTTMMDGVDEFSPEDRRRLGAACVEMEKSPQKVLIGEDRLNLLKKKVGERIKIYSVNYKDIDLDVEIMGALPAGRYGQSSVMNRDYLINAMDQYKKDHKGEPHPMAARSLNLVWLRVPDRSQFEKVANEIENSSSFKSPAVKCETASSGISSFLDAYRDLLFGVRWLLVPAILATMSLVIANAISISVRERRIEMAVLKVLGFTPNMVLILVLGEALLIGCIGGLFSAVLTQYVVNDAMGGIKFPIAFFPAFKISASAPWWGLGLGAATALAGSLMPAWSARSVKVSEVFAKIT